MMKIKVKRTSNKLIISILNKNIDGELTRDTVFITLKKTTRLLSVYR